jgi:hypothetical protein
LKNGFDHLHRYNNRNYYKGEDIEDALKESWQKMVPKTIINIICENWVIVEKFAQSVDKTIKIFGMKFPTEGILS